MSAEKKFGLVLFALALAGLFAERLYFWSFWDISHFAVGLVALLPLAAAAYVGARMFREG